MARNDCLKKDKTTFGIVDAKSIKNVDTSQEKGYDAGKKVSGIKLHLVVDTLGLPHAVHVTCANVTDRRGAVEMISLHPGTLSSVRNFLVDGGYSGDNFANAVKDIHGASVEVVKRNELHQFKVLPMRWIVERSFGWLEKNRRLWKNCERFLHSSLLFYSEDFKQVLNGKQIGRRPGVKLTTKKLPRRKSSSSTLKISTGPLKIRMK